MACIATIIQWCFTHRHIVRIIRVVCLLGRLRVRLLSLVWQVRIVTLSVLSHQNGWWWCRFLSRSTPYNTVLRVPQQTLHFIEKSSIVSTRRFQSSNRSRKHATSGRENDVFVRRLASANPNTLDEHRVAFVPTFSSLQTTMCRLRNPDKNDFRERHDLMSVMLTIGLFVRRHSVALLFVSADLPARMTQQPWPDRFVSSECFTSAKAHLAIRTDRPRLFLNGC